MILLPTLKMEITVEDLLNFPVSLKMLLHHETFLLPSFPPSVQ